MWNENETNRIHIDDTHGHTNKMLSRAGSFRVWALSFLGQRTRKKIVNGKFKLKLNLGVLLSLYIFIPHFPLNIAIGSFFLVSLCHSPIDDCLCRKNLIWFKFWWRPKAFCYDDGVCMCVKTHKNERTATHYGLIINWQRNHMEIPYKHWFKIAYDKNYQPIKSNSQS